MFAQTLNSIVSGVIVQWSGAIADIPFGWALCDGGGDTPDLRDTFIVCAKEDENGVAKTNITGSLTKVGGNKDHTHTFDDGGHTHSIPVQIARGMGAEVTIDGNTTGSTNATGTTGNPNTIPVPYYALAYIMKL